MKIDDSTAARERRASWRRLSSGRQPAAPPLQRRPPATPPVSFAELLERLSRGRLGPDVAAELLLVQSGQISLEVQFDRASGLVTNWTLRTRASAAERAANPARIAPAA